MLLGRSLSGGIVDNYYAPNISADPVAGLGRRTVAQISQFLRTGAEPHLGVAFGPMAEVVRYSTSALTDADLTAIATYLLGAEQRPDYATPIPILPAERAAGRALYASNCALCHQPNGGGIANAISNLAGNAAVTASLPNSVIAPMINGLAGGGGYGMMPSFAGALSDGEIAAIANYVRTSWGNRASANATPALVARLRQVAGRG
jgi:mono/diheme cytochrome c family protein